jgi:hypothetical protein
MNETLMIFVIGVVIGAVIGAVAACCQWLLWHAGRRKTAQAGPDIPAPPAICPLKGYNVKVISFPFGAHDIRPVENIDPETLMGCLTRPAGSDVPGGLDYFLKDPDVEEILIKNCDDVRITYSSGITVQAAEAFRGPEHYSDILLRCSELNGHFIGQFRVWMFIAPVLDKNKRVLNKSNRTIIYMIKGS